MFKNPFKKEKKILYLEAPSYRGRATMPMGVTENIVDKIQEKIGKDYIVVYGFGKLYPVDDNYDEQITNISVGEIKIESEEAVEEFIENLSECIKNDNIKRGLK